MKKIRAQPKGSFYFTQIAPAQLPERKRDGNNHFSLHQCGGYINCMRDQHNAQQEKTRTLMEYKLEELTKRVNEHNNLIKRTYALEEKMSVHEEQIKVANHRIEDLERKGE